MVYSGQKNGWVRAFQGKSIFMLIFEGLTASVGLWKVAVGPGSRDLNNEDRLL